MKRRLQDLLRRLALAAGLVALIGVGAGCDKSEETAAGEGDKAAATPAEGSSAEGGATKGEAAAPEAAAAPDAEPEAAAADETPKKSVPELRREKLAAAAKAVYCAELARVEGGSLKVYEEHGYPTPSDFNDAWDKDAKKMPSWANDTIAALQPSACAPAAE